MPVILAFGRLRQVYHKFHSIFGYITSLRTDWATGVSVSKKEKKKRKAKVHG